jgi:Ni,Fe-hydrogenase III large subunit
VIKAEELAQSFAMVLEILKWPERLSAGTESEAMHSEVRVSERRTGRAWIEAPRGLMAYRVELAEDGKLNHLGIATPSQRNWYVVAPAVAHQNILQDFPIIDASFNLSVAGWDG